MSTLMQAPIVQNFRKEVDRLLDRFSEGDLQPMLGRWTPPANIHETDDKVIVELEVPGYEPSSIHVSVKDHVLTVRSDKKSEPTPSERRVVQRECVRGPFVRNLVLPSAVDHVRAKAHFHNGLLTITLEKSEDVRARTIAISTT